MFNNMQWSKLQVFIEESLLPVFYVSRRCFEKKVFYGVKRSNLTGCFAVSGFLSSRNALKFKITKATLNKAAFCL